MPTGQQETRPVGVVELTNYRESADRKGAGGQDTLRFLWLLVGAPLLGEPKNSFAIAFPNLSVPSYLGTISVIVYIQI